jgi:hypothetical protein
MVTISLAQSDGTISDLLRDANGAVVGDATVTIVNQAKGISPRTKSNADGLFVSPQLPPGNTVARRGHSPERTEPD